MRLKTQLIQDSELPRQYLRRNNMSANSSSSGEESDTRPAARHAKSRSPPLPPRPQETVVKYALSSSKSSNSDDPRLSRAESECSVAVSDSASESPVSKRSSRLSPFHQDTKSDDEGVLVDALLKVILQSKSVEMKAQLADALIANPSLIDRIRKASEQ